jgi:hypothetical protein
MLCLALFYTKKCKFSFNRLNGLPRGFGAFPMLEILDLTFNNLDEKSLPNNFYELSIQLIINEYYLYIFMHECFLF